MFNEENIPQAQKEFAKAIMEFESSLVGPKKIELRLALLDAIERTKVFDAPEGFSKNWELVANIMFATLAFLRHISAVTALDADLLIERISTFEIEHIMAEEGRFNTSVRFADSYMGLIENIEKDLQDIVESPLSKAIPGFAEVLCSFLPSTPKNPMFVRQFADMGEAIKATLRTEAEAEPVVQ
jgi:hypothetical protein